jgi:hypothetical protein
MLVPCLSLPVEDASTYPYRNDVVTGYSLAREA